MSSPPTTYGLPKKREEVIEALKEAYTNENLDDQEYERRLDETMKAQSIEQLRRVLFDFPAEIRYRIFPREDTIPAPAVSPRSPALKNTVPAISRTKVQAILSNDSRAMPELSNTTAKMSAILGNQKLDFRLSQVLETPIQLHVEAVLGNTLLDLRNEDLAGKQINIHVSGALGNIKILLPRGARIQRSVQLIAGDFKVKDKQRSWIKRLTGSSKTTTEISLDVHITGSYWLGNIQLIY